MRSILKRMFFTGQSRVLVINPPPETKALKAALGREDLTPPKSKASFVLAFAADEEAAAKAAKTVHKSLEPGGIFWLAYPKGPKSCLNDDTLHALMASFGFFGVTSLTLDRRWSAMRFKGL